MKSLFRLVALVGGITSIVHGGQFLLAGFGLGEPPVVPFHVLGSGCMALGFFGLHFATTGRW